LRSGRRRQARVPGHVQPGAGRMHRQRRLLRGPAVLRAPGLDERRVRRAAGAASGPAAACRVLALRAGGRNGRRLLRRRPRYGRHGRVVRRFGRCWGCCWVLVRLSADSMRSHAGQHARGGHGARDGDRLVARENRMEPSRGTRRSLGVFTITVVGAWALAWATGCGSDGAINGPDAGAHGPDATAASDTGPSGNDDASGSGDGGVGAGPDASLTPGVFGGTGGGSGSCLGLGAGCTTAGDCCSGDCAGNVCRYPACGSDHTACTANGECCSQSCVTGACASLNATCKTLGNACAAGSDCCSSLCSNGTCQASSFCGQAGDACAGASDCCTGTCTIAVGATLGTCGGLCCSRACAPWGPTGALVCQPASGCHVVGDLCTNDGDCCGSAGLPGGSGKPVTCDIAPSATVGICRNPMGCKPDGDVCKLQTTSCNASCDCCSGNCETMDTCKQDNMGVPRCAAAQCAAAGAACASSANCCGGSPCVPNAVDGGAPPFVCAGTTCIAACGQCTDNADCCPGTSCVLGAGATHGICGPCGAPPG